MTNRRTAEARAAAIQAELRRRQTPTQTQADYALHNDARGAQADESASGDLSTSERQVRTLTGTRRGRTWEGVAS